MASIEWGLSLIKSESKRLSNYVSGLSEIDLSWPSACEGWSVSDVVAHLIWEAEFTLDIIPRCLRGDVSPMEGFPDPGTKDAQWMDSFFAQSAITRKEKLGQSLLSMFREKHDQLVEFKVHSTLTC